MLLTNFNPPVHEPGTIDGFDAVSSFFAVFGIAEDTCCHSGEVACPRTHGLTATAGPTAGTRLAYGMIQSDLWGSMIADNPWSETSTDIPMGHWLVRQAPITTVPEPATVMLFLAGLLALGFAHPRVRRQR
ncbi:MAG: PEP-CTERM sorting domain-containing protein [Gemmatimonadaceae bacterium]|nr:PEP-CTERM sorting domain-containing protein [Gemmatimonadaceae bacterium]